MNHQHFDTFDDWAQAAAIKIVEILKADVEARGQTSLAVPGGSTAQAVLPLLSAQGLNWSRTVVTLVDERWVNPMHPDSNEGLARKLLGEDLDIDGLFTGDANPEIGLGAAIKRVADLLPLGCVLLGMGPDGHIASLFPNADIEDTTLQAATREDHPRISMTPKTLLNARGVVLAVSGAEKCAVIERALEPGPLNELPVRHVLHQDQTPVSVLTV